MTDATTPESTTDPGDVQAQLAMMKREIDALQVTVAETTRPWYKQASILIAALALLFSFGTTYYSAEQTRKADIHNAKVELRELIQQLTELPQRNVDLNSKYADNPSALLVASGLINTQQIVLAKQAVDIIDDIPEEVSSTEYFASPTRWRCPAPTTAPSSSTATASRRRGTPTTGPAPPAASDRPPSPPATWTRDGPPTRRP
jgi:hypothetical protein